MREEITSLAERCRLSRGNLVALSREVAGCGSVAGPEDLEPEQLRLLAALLTVMASPAPVDDYYLLAS